jgi:mycoredoxin
VADKIVLYGRPTCPANSWVKDMLERADVDYEYVDISVDSSAQQRLREINHGYESVPTLVFPDGSSLTEPAADELKAKLEELGYEAPLSPGAQLIRLVLTHPITRLLGVILVLAGILTNIWWLLFSGVVILTLGLFAGRL